MGLQIRRHFGIAIIFLLCTVTFMDAKENTAHMMEQNTTAEKAAKEPIVKKKIIGAVENVRLIPPNVVLKARIDTGAKTTSIDARNITPFEHEGKQWVRFDCVSGKIVHAIEKKVISTVQIKRHGKSPQTRFVVKMRITLGDVSRLVDVNLNNRDAYTYPILIGRNFLRDNFIVDIATRYRFKPKKHQEEK